MSEPASPRSVAVLRNFSFIAAGVIPGNRCFNSAAAPATCGVAMLVPDFIPYTPPGIVELIFTPGATTVTWFHKATCPPRLEDGAITLLISMEPTAIGLALGAPVIIELAGEL